jgi:hypothetical protein
VRRLLVLAAIIFLVPTASGAQGKPDACRTQIPAAIAELLNQKFPQHRLPLVTDRDSDEIEFNVAKGRSSCILVATGDFNGDKKKDLAIGLTPTTGKVPIVAVALSEANRWTLSTVESWVEIPQRLYVSRAAPGLFKRFEGLTPC